MNTYNYYYLIIIVFMICDPFKKKQITKKKPANPTEKDKIM